MKIVKEKERERRKQKILEFLNKKENKDYEIPTYVIGFKVLNSSNVKSIKELLVELEEEGKVTSTDKITATYWRIK